MQPDRIVAIGVNYMLVEYPEKIDAQVNRAVHRLRRALLDMNLMDIEGMIPTYRSLLIQYNPIRLSAEELHAKIDHALAQEHTAMQLSGRSIVLPVLYGGEKGPDLKELATWNHLSAEEVIKIHTGGSYQVYMIGFNPGYPYLGGLDPRIAMPRRDVPRTHVPAGSVAIGGEQTGVYSTNSPGGWQIIGHTPVPLFNPDLATPVLLEPGDMIKFKSVTEDEYHHICRLVEKQVYEVEMIEGETHEN